MLIYRMSAFVIEAGSPIEDFEAYLKAKCRDEFIAHGLLDLRLQSIQMYVPGGLQLNFVSRTVMLEDIIKVTPFTIPASFVVPQI